MSQRLPKRHRTHQLEAESVLAIQNAIPSTWVYRTPEYDYGIDGEVEIFDEEGLATGNKFLVQLKATDQKKLSMALKLRLRIETANYYDTLESPVLVVRYVSSNKKLYFRWFHSFDPYYEKVSDDSLAFNFTGACEWDSESKEDILSGLHSYYSIIKGKRPFPISIPVYIAKNSPIADGIISFVSEVNERHKNTDIVEFSYGREKDRLPSDHILISKNELKVVLANKTGACLHFDSNENKIFTDTISPNFFIALGLALFYHGFYEQSSRLMLENFRKSILKNDIRTTIAIVVGLVKCGKLKESLEVAEALFSDDEGIDAAQAALIEIVRLYSVKSDQDMLLLSEFLDKISNSLISRDIKSIAAVVEYNHANKLRSNNQFLKNSIRHYILAARFNPEYRERAYWNSELAGCLFLGSKYRCAAGFYKAALDIENNNFVRGLYADSLMMCGLYELSLKEFHTYFENEEKDKRNDEWNLKALCLHAVVDTLEVKQQNRTDSEEKTNALDLKDPEQLINYIKDNDALSPLCWFNLGIINAEQGQYRNAQIGFILAALINGHDPEAWCNAFKCAMNNGVDGILFSILVCAHDKIGDSFFEYLSKDMSKQKGSSDPELDFLLLDMIKILKETKRDENHLDIRIHSNDGSYEKITASSV